mgnify:CR=1 FL=1
MKTDTNNLLNYKIRPSNKINSSSGAVFLIHGYGSNSDDLFSFESSLPKDLTIISLEAPIKIDSGGFAWYSINYNEDFKKWSNDDEAKESIEMIYFSIKELTIKYNLNPLDLSILGFSQGAILSWSIGFNFPKLIRRIIALSGYINEKLILNNNITFIGTVLTGCFAEVFATFINF